ncbi:MAG: NADH-quinone oxidoreductase subunit NuoN [Burkholderiales bacterium]|nr:MAG: NADH-quinone oxidoreductase subunit NuoN [Burkholderiales bacterium]CAG0987716.1 NADH-quinone oxidoreductase subunit N [Myxococcaceae bacterium]
MNFPVPNLYAVAPEIFLLSAVLAILVIDLFVSDGRRHLSYWLTQAALAGAFFITLATSEYKAVHSFSNMVVDDQLSDLLKLCCYAAVSLVLFYSRSYLSDRGMFRGEFFVLALFGVLGMMFMISANNLLILYLGLEVMSLSMYAMIALRRDSRPAVEAAMKYFVLGALASGLLLYGMSMIYGATGTLDLNKIAWALFTRQANAMVLVFGLVFLVSGIAFKLGAVPYHMWVPDVYQGSPTAVTLFIGTAPKIAAFAFVIRLLVFGLQPVVGEWHMMLVILAVLSMVIGNLTAIAQTNLKRMLAYSTIANMGFMLLGVLAGNPQGYSSALFYTVAYVLATLASFGMILLLSRQGFEAENLEDLKGLNDRSPWYAFLMLLVMFSLAGIPPTVGFYAKLQVISAVVDIGYIWLAVVAVLASLIGAFYYLRVVKLMYFDAAADHAPIVARGDSRVLLSLNGLALLGLGILPGGLMYVCTRALELSF